MKQRSQWNGKERALEIWCKIIGVQRSSKNREDLALVINLNAEDIASRDKTQTTSGLGSPSIRIINIVIAVQTLTNLL